jgi:hypothetical protein
MKQIKTITFIARIVLKHVRWNTWQVLQKMSTSYNYSDIDTLGNTTTF